MSESMNSKIDSNNDSIDDLNDYEPKESNVIQSDVIGSDAVEAEEKEREGEVQPVEEIDEKKDDIAENSVKEDELEDKDDNEEIIIKEEPIAKEDEITKDDLNAEEEIEEHSIVNEEPDNDDSIVKDESIAEQEDNAESIVNDYTEKEESIADEKDLNVNDQPIDVEDLKEDDEIQSKEEHININDMESIDSEQVSIIHHLKETSTKIEPEVNKEEPIDDTITETIPPVTPTWYSFEESNSQKFIETSEILSSPPHLNMAYNRYQNNEHELEMKDNEERIEFEKGRDNIKKTFNEIKIGSKDKIPINKINWEFWSEVFNNYNNIVKNKQNELTENITNGIPIEIRGMVWQILSDSNNIKLKEYFINNKNNKSSFEKLIKSDLSRTSFIKNSQIRDKIDDLFNIIKIYSLYDLEVGYTQGMAFITVPLLMNMESDEAFCLLVKLMFTYGFRDMYLPEMPGLHLKIYQFDRLLEDKLPLLFEHLKNQKIKSSMYAIQWFLTLFAYKFPLDMVLRIYDVVITEGLDSILKFAINLMIKNNDILMTLKFDELIEFLKDKLFKIYYNEELGNYEIDLFLKDSMSINILPITLEKYSKEFDEIYRLEKDRELQVKELQNKNGLLVKEIRKIEAIYAILNKEHVEIANEMVKGKLEISSLEEENNLLNEQIEELKNRLHNLTSSSNSGNKDNDHNFSSGELSEGLDKEIQKAMEVNLQVMDENRVLEDRLAELEEENNLLKNNKSNPLNVFGLKKKGKFW